MTRTLLCGRILVTALNHQAPLRSQVSGGELHLLSVKSTDSGTYTCAAENDYGRDAAPAILHIGSPPSIIVSDYGEERC